MHPIQRLPKGVLETLTWGFGGTHITFLSYEIQGRQPQVIEPQPGSGWRVYEENSEDDRRLLAILATPDGQVWELPTSFLNRHRSDFNDFMRQMDPSYKGSIRPEQGSLADILMSPMATLATRYVEGRRQNPYSGCELVAAAT